MESCQMGFRFKTDNIKEIITVIILQVNTKSGIIKSETPDLLVDQICCFQRLCDRVNSKYKA